MKIMHVVGARPNFMKVAPIYADMSRQGQKFQQVLVHTGQHYDTQMSRVFFEDLDLPDPDEYLGVGSGTHAEQTARVMLAFEPLLLAHRPDWVLVVGDVNSTLACTLVCAKLGVPVAHVEAGLRSRDRTMPEEINRLLTDQIADLLFTPSPDGDANLLSEGTDPAKIHFVGNVMIDSLVQALPQAAARPVLSNLGLQSGDYILVTLHRPSNVDQPETLRPILDALGAASRERPVVFPIHPRTQERLRQWDLHAVGVQFIEPQRYLDFLALERSAAVVVTDSGGIQEETTYLGVPCLTLRPNTERPVTIEMGTNRLVAVEQEAILSALGEALSAPRQVRCPPALWDGHAAGRIVDVFMRQGSGD